ncbi:uncharacterized protein LOC144701788 [Wolffia australiana]
MEGALSLALHHVVSAGGAAALRRCLAGLQQASRIAAKDAFTVLFMSAFLVIVPPTVAAAVFIAFVAVAMGLRRLAGRSAGGLTEIETDAISAFVFAAKEGNMGERWDGDCAVCLAEFEEGEVIRRLGCGHCYHGECVGRWLRRRARCPKCAGEVKVEIRGGRISRLRLGSARILRCWFGA